MGKGKTPKEEEDVELLWNTINSLRESDSAWLPFVYNILIILWFVKINNATFFYIILLFLLHCCLVQVSKIVKSKQCSIKISRQIHHHTHTALICSHLLWSHQVLAKTSISAFSNNDKTASFCMKYRSFGETDNRYRDIHLPTYIYREEKKGRGW